MPDKDDYSLLRSHNGRLITAAAHVNERFLGTAYGSTPIHGRLLNQRFLIELSDKKGNKVYTENTQFFDENGKPLHKDKDQFKQGNKIFKVSLKEPHSNSLLSALSYEDAYYAIYLPHKCPSGYRNSKWQKKRDEFLKACDQGQIKIEPNIEALTRLGYTVNHVIHRPNHGLHHSMRTAAYIPMILGLFTPQSTLREVEKLQHMMLFSVVGRLDETGFSETGNDGVGRTTYQGFRSTSGLAYLDYCEQKAGVYEDIEKQQFDHYQDALVVELMGFNDLQSALKSHPCNSISDTWLKNRILNDVQRLVEMGTLTKEEARGIEEAGDQSKEQIVENLVALIQNEVPTRYILEASIPQVLIRFIENNYQALNKNGQLTQSEQAQIDRPPEGETRSTVVKQLLPRILATRGLEFFPFINENVMTDKLSYMNWAHALDLSRCYPLEAMYYTKIIQMPASIDTKSPDWESKLTLLLDHSDELNAVYKQKGYLVIKADNHLYYIRSDDGKGNVLYSKVDSSSDLNLLRKLNLIHPPKETYLTHSQLSFHMAEGILPTGKSQCFGNIQGLLRNCFDKSTDWNAFKIEVLNIYQFLNGIEEMHLRTGERMNFQLRSKEDLKAFLESAETKELYEQYKNSPVIFIAKFTSKSINVLYDANHFGNYNYAKAFRIFADAPHVTEERDYRVEAVNCARLIDSGLKPEQALKTDNLPEIQSLSYNPDTKEMTLTFANLESPINFETLYREIIKPSSETLKMSELSVTLPLADYNYLKDNRFLKFKLETVPKQHSGEEDLIDFNTGEYKALKLIRDHKAIVRLHNTLKNKEDNRAYEGELDAMEHPMDNRHVAIPERFKRLLAQPEGEKSLINQRKKVQHPLTREERIREVQLEPAPPLPQYQQPQIPELDHPDLAAKRMFEVRGGAKNTRFLTKAPYTLLEPTGNTQLFMGATGSRSKYFPIGILSDIDQTYKGGETYIWTGRANSWEKYWLGDKTYKLSELPQGLSLEQLKKLQREGEDPNEHNELLLRSGKVASRALVTPKNTLIDRLNLVAQAINIKRQFSISLPLIILDPGDPECPKPYTEDMIRLDIQDVVKAVRDNSFEFDRSEIPDIIDGSSYRMPRDKDSQNEIVAQLLNECGFTVSLNPDQNLLPENKLSINSETPEETDAQKIEKFLQDLSISGGKVAQMQQIADAPAFDALPTEKKDEFFIKQAALGHADVIEHLLNTTNYRPSDVVCNKAIKIAYSRHGGELANHLVIQLTKAEVVVDKAVLAADEVANLGVFPAKHPDLDTAVIAFQKLQKQLAPLAFQNDLMSKAEAAMKQIHPKLLGRNISGYRNIEHYYATPLLEVLRQLDKAEARLKRSIGEIRRRYPLTEQQAKSLQIAQKLVQNPDKLKENAIETYLTQEDKFNLIDEVLKKNSHGGLNLNILKDMFYTVIDKRNTNLSYAKQMKLALARWQLSNPPMSESCANYFKGMTTFLFREQSKIKVTKIIDALWNDKLGDLIALDPEIGKKFNQERISYSQPSLAQMELALFHWQNHNVTKNIPMNEACKSYLRAIASQPSSEKAAKILTTLWNGNFSELLNLSPEVAQLFITEGRNENHPFPAQMELALARWQVNDLTKSTAMTEVNKGYLREIVSQSPSTKKIKQLVSTLWKGDLQELFELAPQIREQFIIDSREKMSSCLKELQDLQPDLIKTKDEINNQKALVLKKAQEIFDKATPVFKDKRLMEIEHRALNTVYQDTLARLEKQFDDLNIDALEIIQQISVDFSKCLSVQQVEVEGQRLTLKIENAKASLDSPLLKKALEAKAAEVITASNDQMNVLITKTFKEKHQAMFEKDKQSCGGKWRNTTVTEETTLKESIKHAKEYNNRTRQAFIDLGWMNKKGEVTKSAPDLMQKLNKETSTLAENRSIIQKFKKLAGALQNPEKDTDIKGLSKS